MTDHAKIALALLLGPALLASGCDNRATTIGVDAGSDDSNGSTTSPGCVRPVGTCYEQADCPGGSSCVGVRHTTWLDQPGCVTDPCCTEDADGDGQWRDHDGDGDRAFPSDPIPLDAGNGAVPPGARRMPPCSYCLGTCVPAGCRVNADCPAGWYCDLGSSCTPPGTCEPRPICDQDGMDEERPEPDSKPDSDEMPFAPADAGGAREPDPYPRSPMPPPQLVCGCDGRDYAKACYAGQAGVSVAHAGSCADAPVHMPCTSHAECGPAGYCHREEGCLAAGLAGVCQLRPTSCEVPFHCPWVCGCDGNSYCTACESHSAGVNVADEGACLMPDPGDPCLDVACELFEDCCSCAAIDVSNGGDGPVPCPAICEAGACTARGFGQAGTYCLEGHCLLGDLATACQDDGDCYLANDCCNCAALPLSVVAAPCDLTCLQPHCDALGLGAVKARCLGGRCRVAVD